MPISVNGLRLKRLRRRWHSLPAPRMRLHLERWCQCSVERKSPASFKYRTIAAAAEPDNCVGRRTLDELPCLLGRSWHNSLLGVAEDRLRNRPEKGRECTINVIA